MNETPSAGQSAHPRVDIVGGSRSDFPVLDKACAVLDQLGIPNEMRVVSAHRTPDLLFRYAEQAAGRGVQVIIAGAGGAAHLPGMLAAKTLLPIIGVPIPTQHLGGLDSLLSIVQMPRGIPVATVAIGNAENAALLAAEILALSDAAIRERVAAYREAQTRPSRWMIRAGSRACRYSTARHPCETSGMPLLVDRRSLPGRAPCRSSSQRLSSGTTPTSRRSRWFAVPWQSPPSNSGYLWGVR